MAIATMMMMTRGAWRACCRGAIAACLLPAAVAAAPPDKPFSSPVPVPAPVVVELFTSEGCSSCPPADDLLRTLVGGTLTPGIAIIGLSEHVDYWNQLGWQDPYSSSAFAKRQTDYNARVFHLSSVYTPQVVVDGRRAEVGSDRAQVLAAIHDAAAAPKLALTVRARRSADGASLAASVDGSTIAKPATLVVIVTEDGLASDVTRGENSGRHLTHASVARAIAPAGAWSPASPAGQTVRIAWKPAWTASRISVVALLQDRATQRIIGAGVTRLTE